MSKISARPWYKDWFSSPFYHKLYFERDEKEAQAFIESLIHFLQPAQKSRILDIACGHGRQSRMLADMQHEVTGIDLSFDSISHTKQYERENLSFYQHDIRLPFWINYFDYAFGFFKSFGHFDTRREHDDAIRTIAASLKPGGVFLIDYRNVHYLEDHYVYNETKNINGTDYEIHRWNDDNYFYKRVIVTDSSLITPIEFTEKIMKFSPGDFTDMLAFNKMQVLEIFGDNNLSPYDVRKSPRMIIVARKKSIDPQPGEKAKRLYSDGRKTDSLT